MSNVRQLVALVTFCGLILLSSKSAARKVGSGLSKWGHMICLYGFHTKWNQEVVNSCVNTSHTRYSLDVFKIDSFKVFTDIVLLCVA